MPNPKIWVPQPATNLYRTGGNDPETLRDRLVKHYGESTVLRAEVSVLLDLALLTGQIKPSEFVEVLTKKLARTDEHRRAAANLDSDRG